MPPLRQREEIRRALLSPGQPAFAYVKERVAAEDVAALQVLRDGNTPLHRMLTPRAAAATSVRSLVGHPPFLSEEPAATQSLRASAAMGLALVGDAGRSADELATGLLWLRAVHAHPGHELPSLQALLKRTDAGHATRLRRLVDAVPTADQDLALSALMWLLALEGALPQPHPAAKATVLFDDGRSGVRGTLALAVLPQGPAALLPDPRVMSGFRGDKRFRQSLRDAWDGIGRGVTTTVLWSLTDPDGVVGMVEDNSLGCAFAVLLGEAERAGRRVRPPALRRINPRTALVGGLDAARPGALVSVGGYAAKLKAAGEGANVVVPAADRDEARQALPGGTADRLLFAATVGEAARRARVWDFPVVKRVSYTVVATLSVLVLLSLYLANRLGAAGEAEARRALASDLAAEAMLLRETDPRLAALLGLAGYTMEPDTPRAVQAMRDVLEANSGVRLSWRASPEEVHSIAVDDRHGRVYTTGDDPYLKSWDLLTGKELGRTGGAVTDLVLDHASGLLAARDGTAVSVYSMLRPVPRLMGRLAAPSCGGKGGKPVANAFTGNGARLVEVLSDGAVAQYDTTTLEEIDCRRTGDVVNQGRLIRAADDSVLDATAAPSPSPALAGQPYDEDKALLLLSSGDVMALGLDSHKLSTEIGRSDVQGNALQIDAGDTAVLLATPLGVQAWDRRSRRTLSFPVGGLSYRPRAMTAYHGSVAIAGNDGTALVPVGGGDDRIGSRGLEEPRGGPAFTAAVGDLFTVVSGGRGGRVNVLDDRPQPLGLSPTPHADAASFGPDGLLLLAHGGEPFSPDSVYTTDPRTTPKIALNPATQEYAHVAEYPLRDTFEFRDAATAGPLVAAVGRSDGNAAAAVVWRGKGADPKVLPVPGPDRAAAAAGERLLTAVAFVPEADLLVARHATGPLAIWSTRTWQLVATVPLTAGSGLAVHGTQALALENRGPEGPRIVLVDLTTRTITRSAAVPGARFLDWSRDGTRIAVLTRDNTVHYRDAALKETGEALVLPETAEAPTAMVLSPDGRRIAIAVDDHVLVHETATGLQALPTLSAAAAPGTIRLSWSPDGDFLAGVGRRDDSGYFAAGAVNVWRVGGIDWRRQICRWTGGSGLSTEEWQSHIGDRHPYVDLCAETK
ncbi:WD40 repeat domain-containing protein [Streptomyces sp. HO565]|uniref:WD40 repeat domain-containing protein n=1 Tax=Streptomyces sp. HO565 TaxID=2857489 RepID=UPI0034DC975A